MSILITALRKAFIKKRLLRQSDLLEVNTNSPYL